ncbi:hypothetical protein JCM33374_g3866 [Metschnikowia sp. JCM 33374]|nr:hypothetical protein JCM33374_g3866 [Metschnikowia sp. JCM 33374]
MSISKEMAGQESEKDNFPTEESRDPTIFGKKIKRDDFDHLMSFYHADHKLSQEERQVMSKDLTNSGLSTMLWALLDSSIVVTTPLIYRRYKEKKLGSPLPTPARLPAFLRSMFFSVAGLGVYFWSSKYHAKTDQDYRIACLQADCASGEFSEQETESKQRLLDVWKTLDSSKLSLFTVYYFKTASDPSLAMKSPKDMVSFDPHAVMYVPPPQGKDGPLQGVFGAVKEHERNAPHWQKIREENGFAPPKSEVPESPISTDSTAANTDNFVISEDPKITDDPALESEKGTSENLSAWERLRKRS